MKTILCAGFPGTGKSYFFNSLEYTILDSDSSTFDKKDFPNNYMSHIKKNIDKADFIMISSHKDVRDALVKENLDFVLFYPDKKLKSKYLTLYRNRRNAEEFIKLISDNWDNWILECEEQKGCVHIVLKENQYISNIIRSLY